MFARIALAFLLSASPVDAGSPYSAPTEPLKVSVGKMSFSGSTIKLTKSDNEALECDIDGRAEFTLTNSDFAIAAQKIVISRTANSEITIRCTGDCRFTDPEHTCRADSMQIRIAKQFKLELTGNCRVEYGEGEERTTLAGESITFHDGTFNVSGAASLKRGQ